MYLVWGSVIDVHNNIKMIIKVARERMKDASQKAGGIDHPAFLQLMQGKAIRL